jgi:hypothetical protein
LYFELWHSLAAVLPLWYPHLSLTRARVVCLLSFLMQGPKFWLDPSLASLLPLIDNPNGQSFGVFAVSFLLDFFIAGVSHCAVRTFADNHFWSLFRYWNLVFFGL